MDILKSGNPSISKNLADLECYAFLFIIGFMWVVGGIELMANHSALT